MSALSLKNSFRKRLSCESSSHFSIYLQAPNAAHIPPLPPSLKQITATPAHQKPPRTTHSARTNPPRLDQVIWTILAPSVTPKAPSKEMCKFSKKICPTCRLPLPNKNKATACFPRRLHKKAASKHCVYLVDETFTGSHAACWNCADEEEVEAGVQTKYTTLLAPRKEVPPVPSSPATPVADLMDVDTPPNAKNLVLDHGHGQGQGQGQNEEDVRSDLSWFSGTQAKERLSHRPESTLSPELSWSPDVETEEAVRDYVLQPTSLSLPPGFSWSPEPELEADLAVQSPPPPAMSLPPAVLAPQWGKKQPVDSLRLYNRGGNWAPAYR